MLSLSPARYAVVCLLPLVTFIAASQGCSSSSDNPGTPDPDATPGDDGGTSETSTGEGGKEAGANGLSPDYVDYDINAVVSTGQSNSVGNGGTTILTPSAGPYNNLMFDTGVMSMSGCNMDTGGCKTLEKPTSMVPIHEGDTYFYPVETPATAIANQITKIALETFKFGSAGSPAKHDVFVANDGRSGWTYWCLRKGSCNYQDPTETKSFEQTITEVTAAKAMADAKSLKYAVRAVTVVHGESDSDGYISGHPEFPQTGSDGSGSIADYADAMVEWQRDMETSITAVTGQKTPIPLLIAQLSGWRGGATTPLPQMQLDAHTTKAPGKVVLVTPTYMFKVAEDCLHYDSDGERWLGEYFAKAYAQIVFRGQPWEPLRPTSITRAGAVITVKFLVPKPPLVFDTTAVSAAPNMGFDVVDGTNAAVTISKVELSGSDSVNITLAAAPTGAVTVRYAQVQATPDPAALDLGNYNSVPTNTCIGPGTQMNTLGTYKGGPRGNLHDSDDTPSQLTYNLANWAVGFSQSVN